MKRFLLLFKFLFFFIFSIYAREESFMSFDGNNIILQKRTGMTFASQVTKSNTTYEIRDVFDLNGKTITLPENCTLIFAGGALRNGTLVGNNTYLIGSADVILEKSLNFRDANLFHIEGISFPKGKDISAQAQRMLDVFNVLNLETGVYYLTNPLVLKNNYAKIKGAGKGTILTTDRVLDYAIRTALDEEVSTPGSYYNVSFVEISDIKIDGRIIKNFKNGIFLDGPSCTISNCFVTNIQSVGIKLCEWCNNLFNCVVTHCELGVLITTRANAVNICYNRIESNTVNVAVYDFSGVTISNNTLEGSSNFEIIISKGKSCRVRENYFEGCPESITSKVASATSKSLSNSAIKELKGLLWVGSIDIKEKNCVTEISYLVGNTSAPRSVSIQDNFIDIHNNEKYSNLEPDAYFVLVGSCYDYCVIRQNTFLHTQTAVCGFLNIDKAVLKNFEATGNYFSGTTRTINPINVLDNQFKVTRIGKY